jgi:MFS family permease
MITKDTAKIAADMTPGKPQSLWHNRDYLLLWGGQAVSNFGTQASLLAFPLLVLVLTHSPAQAAIIGALRLVPYIFLSLPVGAVVDRWNRKRLMIVCDTIRALVLGSIPLAFAIGHLTLIQIYVASLLEGTLYVFFNLAQSSCLPHVVSSEQLPAALGQNQAAEGASFLLGPSMGGVLFGLNQLLPFLADAISYAASVISLFFIRVPFQEKRAATPHRLHQEVMEGLTWLWHQPILRFMALRNSVVNFSYAGASLLVIVLAQHQRASSATIGLILAIGGVGYLLGSLVGPSIQKRFSYGQVIIGITWAYLLWWSLYLVAFTPILLGIITAILSINRPVQNVVTVSYRLVLVPDEMRGRVSSVNQLLSWCAIPLGTVVTGILLQQVGTTATILFFSACFLILAVITNLNSHIRRARPLAELQKR